MKWPRSSTFGSSQPPSGRADEGSPALRRKCVQQPVHVEREQILLIELHRMQKRTRQQPDVLEIESNSLERNDRFDLVLNRTGGLEKRLARHRCPDEKPPERNAQRLQIPGICLRIRSPLCFAPGTTARFRQARSTVRLGLQLANPLPRLCRFPVE